MPIEDFVPITHAKIEGGLSPPDPIVSMMEHHGMVFVATTRMVYVKGEDNVLRPLRFASPLDD